jgi:UDP-N-acetylglucosamine--N-acetylmuramyl-(pentapeptide) pyrophosphoryl-undecaprenol N-acetylglucosamine transferase
MIQAPEMPRGARPARPASRTTVAVFSGGGTGGHLYPALALAAALQTLRPDLRPIFVGARRGLEARVLPARGVEHLLLPVEGFRRGAILGNLGVLRNLARAFAGVAGAFRSYRPDLVVVTGGYAGGPAGLVAVLMRVPLVVQEQNSVPGITTRALSRFAREIHLAFPEAVGRLPRTARHRARVSGNPVREPREVDRRAAAARFGLDPQRPIALVVGGSQGSIALNRAVLKAVTLVMEGRSGARKDEEGRIVGPRPDLQLLWSTGPAHLTGVVEALDGVGGPDWVRAVGYIEEMSSALGLADVAVSRAGAMATSEFLAWGLPAVLVPFPFAAADHQRLNARALAEAGAAVLIEEEELTGRTLWAALTRLVEDDRARTGMAERARARGRPEAARTIAESLARLLPAPVPPTVARDEDKEGRT